MTWYEKLKFEENPLDARPNSNLVGLEEQEARLINFIEKEEICFLNGPTGSGKTSLLKKVQERLKDHKFIYLDAQDLPSDFNLEDELKKKRSFFDRIRLKKYPSKKPILLVDEFQATDPDLVLEARSKWDKLDERKIKNIVIAQINRQLRNVDSSFRERLGKRIIHLPHSLDDEAMKEILKIRLYNKKTNINYANRINNKAIKLVVRAADGNVRRLLEFTDLLFDYHHRKFGDKNPLISERYIIPYYVAKNILEEHNINLIP